MINREYPRPGAMQPWPDSFDPKARELGPVCLTAPQSRLEELADRICNAVLEMPELHTYADMRAIVIRELSK